MQLRKIKRLTRVRNMLLPLVYKYPYNHHKPIPVEILKAIGDNLNK